MLKTIIGEDAESIQLQERHRKRQINMRVIDHAQWEDEDLSDFQWVSF